MNLNNYIKSLSIKDKKTLSQKGLKLAEEVGELAKAILPYDSAHGTNHRFIDKEKILEEVYKLNHYTNFQPLCSKVNRDIKRDKIEVEYAIYDTNVTHDAKWITG